MLWEWNWQASPNNFQNVIDKHADPWHNAGEYMSTPTQLTCQSDGRSSIELQNRYDAADSFCRIFRVTE